MSGPVLPPVVPPYTSDPPPPYPYVMSPQRSPNPPVLGPGYQRIIQQHQSSPSPKDYLAFSIFTLFCCCLPIGLAAVFFSIKTRDSMLLGDVSSAQKFSRLAWILNIVAMAVGVITCAVVVVFQCRSLMHLQLLRLNVLNNRTQSFNFTM